MENVNIYFTHANINSIYSVAELGSYTLMQCIPAVGDILEITDKKDTFKVTRRTITYKDNKIDRVEIHLADIE